MTRISGTRYDGVYQAQITMNPAAPGGHSLKIHAQDNFDNDSWTEFGQQVVVGGG